MKGKKRPIFITSTLKTIPKFDSNSAYLIIQQRMNYFILNGVPYNSLKVFFWVGSRSSDYEKNFEDTILIIRDFE